MTRVLIVSQIDKDIQKERDKVHGEYHDRPKYGGIIRGYPSPQWERPYELDPSRHPPRRSFHLTGKPFSGYGTGNMNEEKEEIIYTWYESRTKEPGADYKPGKFKHLDEAIRNTKKVQRIQIKLLPFGQPPLVTPFVSLKGHKTL